MEWPEKATDNKEFKGSEDMKKVDVEKILGE